MITKDALMMEKDIELRYMLLADWYEEQGNTLLAEFYRTPPEDMFSHWAIRWSVHPHTSRPSFYGASYVFGWFNLAVIGPRGNRGHPDSDIPAKVFQELETFNDDSTYYDPRGRFYPDQQSAEDALKKAYIVARSKGYEGVEQYES